MQKARENRLVGRSVNRVEDSRIILGRTRYVDDIKIPSMGYVGILRSPYSHARIKRLDVHALNDDPRVIGYVTGEELKTSVAPTPFLLLPTGCKKPTLFALATDKVRYQLS
jgi:carbon-monoxide dehydrogenase large subunit